MKLVSLLIALLFAGSASAATLNQTAKDLENAYLNVAEILSTSHQKNGPCGDIESYTYEIVDASLKAKGAYEYNWEWNKQLGRKFTLRPQTILALSHTMILREISDILDASDPQSVSDALSDVILWGPATGAYGNSTYLHFGPNNTVKRYALDIDTLQWTFELGTYTVSRDMTTYRTYVDFDYNGVLESFILSRDYPEFMWNLVPNDNNPTPNPYFDGYVDYPSECDA